MNELYPIIRRKRRPLIVQESVPDRPPKPPVVVKIVEPEQLGRAASDSQVPDRVAPAGDTADCIAASASPTAAPS